MSRGFEEKEVPVGFERVPDQLHETHLFDVPSEKSGSIQHILSHVTELLRSGRPTEALQELCTHYKSNPENIEIAVTLVRLLLVHDLDHDAKAVLDELQRKCDQRPELCRIVSVLQSELIEKLMREGQNVVSRLANVMRAVLGGKKYRIDILDYTGIGGLSVDARWMPKMRAAGAADDVIFFSGKPVNEQLLTMLARVVPVLRDDSFVGAPKLDFDWNNQLFSLNEDAFKERFWGRRYQNAFNDCVSFMISTNGRRFVTHERLKDIDRLPHGIEFTPEETKKGEELLRTSIGVPNGYPIVGLQLRDSAFYQETDTSGKAFRNVDPNLSKEAIQRLTARGNYVVRFGAKVAAPLDCQDPRFIDYASKCRSEFMDVYLMSKLSFLVAVPTGMTHLADLFSRPVLHINSVNMYGYSARLYIPKKVRCIHTGRLLGFKEAIDRIYSYPDFMNLWEDGLGQREKLGIMYEENSSEEIAEAAEEMARRLEGTYRESAETAELQNLYAQFWKPYPASFYSRETPIASAYLLRNRQLLF